MDERSHRFARILSVVGAAVVALACGTNYAYSAWAPQYAERLQLSTTQSNLIGVAGNIGMYASGIPVGMLVDRSGPRPPALLGAACLALGYYPLQKAFENGPGSMSVFLMCFLNFLTGVGSCSASSAALKTAALNWPHHRGTATAFPLSAFGLSALFFTTLSNFAFPGDTSSFLLMLSVATFCMIFVGMFFLQVVKGPASYTALPGGERPGHTRNISSSFQRPKSRDSDYVGKGAQQERDEVQIRPQSSASDRTSLMSETGDISPEDDTKSHGNHSHRAEISGLALLRTVECWQLFILLGLLTGVGLMTINNIGHDSTALWSHYDDSVSKEFIASKQLLHVSIISFGSFLGRLGSGIGSDFLVKNLNMSRFWCLVTSASVFTLAQFTAINIENPTHLWIVSTLTGLAYGALFGVFPAVVADAFGVNVMTQNWGFMTLSPVISGNIFNLCYGRVYDHHSTELDGGQRECTEGLDCYRGAYGITFAASLIGLLVTLWSIRHEHRVKRKEREEIEFGSHDA
ncbi:uncharacterized protein K452DRAFT_236919 [Aplosporella prunicola CBS 121167]|uniref:Uncharacterized protein n=1 Tax=Aplosporella prunicola CBS 121167 TaxID=1176127 RepID=A0A6A6B0K3_9PEZI|nr:uncharacterized protein K452DRAFT_236919 [Aplosporella prunicola CBS 121167]KAF2136765.1 hypothetical protein K452DRAFT_236919 [Aplosporella prunicola CBS 121167]